MERLTEEKLKERHKVHTIGEKDIFAKARKFTLSEQAKAMGLYPYYQTMDFNEGSHAIIDGKKVVMLGSNNYLGLTTHPEVRKASADAVLKYGSSMTGSRILNGTLSLHKKLEKELAEFLGKEDALVFTTGYQANIGAMSALLEKDSYVFVDRFAHASIYDAIRVGRGTRIKFNHNDLSDLEEKINSVPENAPKLIVVDGVYSMEGDLAPLPELIKIKEKYNCGLYVDDAHGIGVMGEKGQGTSHFYGLQDKVDLIMGTFSKSLASIGGVVAGEKKVIEYIRHFGRSIVFSASLSPANTMAALTALSIIKREPERVARVKELAKHYRNNLKSLGFEVPEGITPIVPIYIRNELNTLMIYKELIKEGVYVNAVIHPAVPKDGALLRTSVVATHTKEDLEFAVEKIYKVSKKFGVVK